mgnify:CR=1 FL=1
MDGSSGSTAGPLPFLGGIFDQWWSLLGAQARLRAGAPTGDWLTALWCHVTLRSGSRALSCALLQALSRLPPTDKQARH